MHQRFHEDDLAGRIIKQFDQIKKPYRRLKIRAESVGPADDPLGRPAGEMLWDDPAGYDYGRFLRDRSRNRFNMKTGKLEVSKLFDWYKGDFDKPFRGSATREAFLGRYAESLADEPREQQLIREGRQPVIFLDYDWSLNDRR